MKKNWKILLIVAMALVIVFTLVACDPEEKGKGGTGNEAEQYEYDSIDYFKNLWDATSGIGDEEIADGNVYLSAELGVRIGTREYEKVNGEVDSVTGKPAKVTVGFKNDTKSIELGIKLEAILDRTSEDSKGTAIKAELYSGDVEIMGLYYALAHPDDFYIDFAGQKILFPLHVEFDAPEGDETVHYSNASLGAELLKALGMEFTINNKQTTFNTLLDAVIDGMGEEWSLDNLVNTILPLVGFAPADVVNLVKGFSEPLAKALVNDKGELSIGSALTSPTIASLGLFNAYNKDGKYLLTSSMLSSMIGGFVAPEKGNATPFISVMYELDGKELKDGVTIGLDIEDSSKVLTMGSQHPYATVQIKDLEFGKATATTHTLPTPTGYKPEFQLEVKETLDIAGATLNGEELDKQVVVGASASLDLDEEKDAPAANKTQANVYVQYGEDKLIEASFVKGRLAVELNRDLEIGGYKLIDKLIEGFGPTIMRWVKNDIFQGQENALVTEFEQAFFEETDDPDLKYRAIKDGVKGAVFTDIDPYVVLDLVVGKIVDSAQPAATSSTAKTAATFDNKNISDLLYLAFEKGIKSLADGKIEIENDNIVGFVCDFVNKMFNLPDTTTKEDAWKVVDDKSNRTTCVTQLRDMIIDCITRNQNPDVEFTPDTWKLAREKAAADIEAILGEMFAGDTEGYVHLEIDGINFSKKPADKTYLEYLVEAVLVDLKANVKLDFTKGLDWTVEATLSGGAKITYTSEITVKAYTEQADLAKGITKDNATQNGWIFMGQ